MKVEQIRLTGSGGTELQAMLWQPEGKTLAVLQITHGMTEHIGRYEDLARELCGHGIALAGFDLRGHGRNPGSPDTASLGEGGWEASLEDMRLFYGQLRQRFPDAAHYMLGFSLGSFLLREYLGRYPAGVAGAVIAGTGHESGWLLGILMALLGKEIRKAGFDGTTDLVRKLSFGTYNQKFKPCRTEADWLCGDREALDRYLADPLVRKDISAGLFRDLLGSMKRTGRADSYRSWNRDMPVLFLYGAEDPVGKAGKGVAQVRDMLRKAGLRDLDSRGFAGARHDIFHEDAGGTGEEAARCIAGWLKEKLERTVL